VGAFSRRQLLRVRAKRAQAARSEPARLTPVAGNSSQTSPARAHGSEISSNLKLRHWPVTGLCLSVEGTPERLRPFLTFLAPVTQKDRSSWEATSLRFDGISYPIMNFARPLGPPWLCSGGASGRPQPEPLAQWPAPVIAVRLARTAGGLRDRRDRRGRRDCARVDHTVIVP
jgi:hypothetical protein